MLSGSQAQLLEKTGSVHNTPAHRPLPPPRHPPNDNSSGHSSDKTNANTALRCISRQSDENYATLYDYCGGGGAQANMQTTPARAAK